MYEWCNARHDTNNNFWEINNLHDGADVDIVMVGVGVVEVIKIVLSVVVVIAVNK